MLGALVLEDEWAARNYLVELINASGLAQVTAAVSDVSQARETLARLSSSIDVVFVDIRLSSAGGDVSGLEFVREQMVKGSASAFVLATASPEHAVTGFELGTVDYVLKPFTEKRVRQSLERAGRSSRAAAAPQPRSVVARRKNGLVFLSLDEVYAFEASGRLTFVNSRSGRFDVDLSLAALDSTFQGEFLRPHRNWLVNRRYIKVLERGDSDLELCVGASLDDAALLRVPVARERAAAVRDALLASATGLRK
jgi:DNA-binding LytR/AlgR family response regulator